MIATLLFFATPLLAEAAPSLQLDEGTLTVAKVAGAIWIASMLTDIWNNVRPRKSLEDKILKQLADTQALTEQRSARCVAERDAKVTAIEVRFTRDFTRLEGLIVQIQEDRKESVKLLHAKLDGLRGDVFSQIERMVTATNAVTRDYSMLIGEMKGELKVRREVANGKS